LTGRAGLACQVAVPCVDVHSAREHVISHAAVLPHDCPAAAVRRAVCGDAGDLDIGVVRQGAIYRDIDEVGQRIGKVCSQAPPAGT